MPAAAVGILADSSRGMHADWMRPFIAGAHFVTPWLAACLIAARIRV